MPSKWTVWYESKSLQMRAYDSKEDAYQGAFWLEDDIEWPKDVVAIEDPDGNYVDLDEWRAWSREESERRDAREQVDSERAKWYVRVIGPGGKWAIDGWDHDEGRMRRAFDEAVEQYGVARVRLDGPITEGRHEMDILWGRIGTWPAIGAGTTT